MMIVVEMITESGKKDLLGCITFYVRDSVLNRAAGVHEPCTIT